MDWERAAKKYLPSSNPVLELNAGRIAFGLSGRAWDEVGHDLIVLELKEQPVTFGEWVPKSIAGSSGFRVEILNFGYYHGDLVGAPDAGLVGAPDAGIRRDFTNSERLATEEMIRTLFASSAPQASNYIFHRPWSFSGDVTFSPGWIREKHAVGRRRRWWRKE